ncbi:hypothetical protein [Aliagarivorans taiwanensis]|uniref:hypothetical protein n=1 Tax=Aliagarivorans taiwanensis TaxID=561966 RepID=UPI0003FA7F77|nr:hypothetical protein [Aliagarivorans taiwanensis]
MKPTTIGALALFALLSHSAHAGVIAVDYTGSYHEMAAPGGDFDGIGGLEDVALFSLVDGVNLFQGAVQTPDDPADVFLIEVAADQTLVAASIEFGSNLFFDNDDFSYNYLFAAPGPQWTLEESSETPTIFDVAVGSDFDFSPTVIDIPLSLGEGIYSMLLGNGTFTAVGSDGGYYPVEYQMSFTIESDTPTAAAPAPAVGSLFGLALLLLTVQRRRA